MGNMGQFIVEVPAQLIGGRWIVIGRCRADLRRGEHLRFLMPYSVEKRGDEYETKFSSPVMINLVVERISAYRHDFDVLNRGDDCKT